MAEINWRIAREKLLAKEQIYRSQGKIELANKMLRIDQSLITGNFINAKKLAKTVKISEVDRIIKNLPTASITDKKGAISGNVKGGDIVKQFQQHYNPTKPPGNVAPPKGAPKSKFNYEIGAEYLWNHLSENKNIQSLVKAGDLETVNGYLDTLIRQAKVDKNHPLNFNNIVKKYKGRGFV